MTFTKTGLSRAFLFLATGTLLLSAAPVMAAAPRHKAAAHPTAGKNAPAAPAKVAPVPAPARTAGLPASSPTSGPAVTARKGRGSF